MLCKAKSSMRFGVLFASALLVAACGGGGGGKTGAATTSAQTTPTPSLSFSSSAPSVAPGGSISLSWQSSNAGSCRASGGWSGDKSISGSETVGPLQQAQSFSLSCSGVGGAVLREVAVGVSVDQTGSTDVDLTLNSDVASVVANGQAHLSWSSSNADSCEAESTIGWNGPVELNGVFTSPPLTTNTTFKVTCFAQGQSAESSLTVAVVDTTIRWQAPTENVDGTPLTNLAGFNVYWGDSPRSYSGNIGFDASAREWDVELGSGTFYLAITAIDGDAEESAYSNEVVRVIP